MFDRGSKFSEKVRLIEVRRTHNKDDDGYFIEQMLKRVKYKGISCTRDDNEL